MWRRWWCWWQAWKLQRFHERMRRLWPKQHPIETLDRLLMRMFGPPFCRIQSPPNEEFQWDGTPNPLFDPGHKKPNPSPPPPPKKRSSRP